MTIFNHYDIDKILIYTYNRLIFYYVVETGKESAMEIAAFTYVGNFGQTVDAFELSCSPAQAKLVRPEDFHFSNAFNAARKTSR